ncbi:hypothetical protein JOD18_004033 [Gracilibacillus alcaliphilus]|nr:hypothetical protein [Gracilibacillus alcaliphilus]
MISFDKLVESLNKFIAKAEEAEGSIIDEMEDFPGLELLPKLMDDFETAIARLLRVQRKRFVDEFNVFIAKDNKDTLGAFLVYMKDNLFAEDEFAEEFGEEAARFLELTTEELSKRMMESIDRDVSFNVLSKRTTDWISNWSSDLGNIMKLNTHEALEKELINAIDNGESIAQAELRIKDLPQFDRKRAKTTAQTEILTASSQAHYESFMQSPAVTGKKWKHSGSKNNNPRVSHMAMDGVEIPVDDRFYVDGEFGLYPRDPDFSAKNRVNCKCVLGPAVDEDILGLSKEEKELIRQEALDEMNSTSGSGLAAGGNRDDNESEPLSFVEKIEPEDIPEAVQFYEDNIRYEQVENAFIIQSDGEVYHKKGVAANVNFTDDELKQMKDAVVTHNHPIEETQWSFSKEDFQLFVETGMRELRATDEQFTYSLSGKSNTPVSKLVEIYRESESEALELILESGYDFEEIDFYRQHEIMKIVTDKLGIDYRRWKVD